MTAYPSEQFVLAYNDFSGNIRLLYLSGNYARLYKADMNSNTFIDKSKYLELFYAIIDEINEIAYIKECILRYLANNVYLMDHYPKSQGLMKLLFEYAVIAGGIARIPEKEENNNGI